MTQTMGPAPLMDSKAAARILGVSQPKFFRMIADGTAPRSIRIGRSRKFDPRDVQAWIDARRQEAAPAEVC